MSAMNNGGSAFPCPRPEHYQTELGMTLRDWFAGQALAGFYGLEDNRAWDGTGGQDGLREWQKEIALSDARAMYQMADAMIAVRKE